MKQRKPKAPTRIYLERYALWYLERWPAPRVHLRRMLHRKIRDAGEHHDFDAEEAKDFAEQVMDRLEELGVLDDDRWVRDKVASGLRKGHSPAKIRAALWSKGLPSSLADDVLKEQDGDPTLSAACSFVRKRRMGNFATRERDTQKDLARLGRAGFPYGIARQVLEMSRDDVEAIVFGP